ncbi:hypothetical protein UCRPA7_6239 [Phaeoacremonium minimum UCRPA7]|uniref:Uncharacterized protein n=1 Tax=Phaeoacremonium minimum (strain UCR-PA7) TaxID=1286976 RepID=R8BG52_PHAM7|nr:hypothetical protein UCRPA7_6239 [Phaeoacremonium minimum UCRPA7]EON98267.1 hypothetical protein UCRPA7_6239 [Phaeoacremonium minimum UCRPA7]
MLKTLTGYIDAFNTNTPEGTIAYRSAGCQHRAIPASPMMPVRNNEEYKAFMAPAFAIMKNFQLKLVEGMDPIIDEEARTGVLHLKSTAETPLGNYKNQYIFTFRLNSDGTEIDEIIEWVDLVVLNDFMPKLLAYAKEHADQAAQ